jgi:predicted dehydrogenase
MIRFGVIGYGYWGPNIVRNLDQLEETKVVAVCDKSAASRRRVQKAYPHVHVTGEPAELMSSAEIDAIAVVTPVWTHYELAKTALENGKHVFVEKPFTSNTAQAEELIDLAARKNLKIMVDHTFLFTGAVRKIKQVLHDGTLGKLYYYDSTRVNLGLFQHDVNVISDLAPHDLSIIDYLIQETPEAVVATGQTHLNGHEDVAFITLYFPDSVIAHINVNWLSPVKVRTTLIGGEKKMLVWNDLEADEKIKIYDKGVNVTTQEGLYNLLVNYRSGDMWAPQLQQIEALRAELAYFATCIKQDEKPINDGAAGLRVVKMLEAANASLRKRGALVYLDSDSKAEALDPLNVPAAAVTGPRIALTSEYHLPSRKPALGENAQPKG